MSGPSGKRRLLLSYPSRPNRFLLSGLAGEVRCYEEIAGERKGETFESSHTGGAYQVHRDSVEDPPGKGSNSRRGRYAWTGATLEAHDQGEKAVKAIAWSPTDEERVALGTSSGKVILSRLNYGGKAPKPFMRPPPMTSRPVTSLDFSEDGKQLAIGFEKTKGSDPTVYVWDLQSLPDSGDDDGIIRGDLFNVNEKSQDGANYVGWGPSSHTLAGNLVAGIGKVVKVYDVKASNKSSVQTFPTFGQGHTRVVTGVRFSPFHPNLILSFSMYDELVKFWDVRHPSEPVATLSGVSSSSGQSKPTILQAEFSPYLNNMVAVLNNNEKAITFARLEVDTNDTKDSVMVQRKEVFSPMEVTHDASAVQSFIFRHVDGGQRTLCVSFSGTLADVMSLEPVPVAWSPLGEVGVGAGSMAGMQVNAYTNTKVTCIEDVMKERTKHEYGLSISSSLLAAVVTAGMHKRGEEVLEAWRYIERVNTHAGEHKASVLSIIDALSEDILFHPPSLRHEGGGSSGGGTHSSSTKTKLSRAAFYTQDVGGVHDAHSLPHVIYESEGRLDALVLCGWLTNMAEEGGSTVGAHRGSGSGGGSSGSASGAVTFLPINGTSGSERRRHLLPFPAYSSSAEGGKSSSGGAHMHTPSKGAGLSGSEVGVHAHSAGTRVNEVERNAMIHLFMKGDVRETVTFVERAVEEMQKRGRGGERGEESETDKARSTDLRMFALTLSGYSPSNEAWKNMARKYAGDMTNPYLRTILRFLASSKSLKKSLSAQLETVLDDPSLPLPDRLGIALRVLNRKDLKVYAQKRGKELLVRGSLQGILLFGVGERLLPLLQHYVDKTGDVQTAAVVTTQLHLHDKERTPNWVEIYRDLLDAWELFFERAKFDITLAKLGNRPATPSLGISCTFCSKSVSQVEGKRLPGVQPKKSNPIACKNCMKMLPRCAVCHLPLGNANPAEKKKGEDKKGSSAAEDGLADRPPSPRQPMFGTGAPAFSHWMCFCLHCGHGGHAAHMEEWFDRNKHCAVTDCNCKCREYMQY